ncbi:MAG: hypothetical protein AAFP04_11845 [Myxococcota bacterium]
MKVSLIYAAMLSLLMFAAHRAHRSLDVAAAAQSTTVEETLASPYATRLLSLGHYAVVADYYWLRALGHFGDATLHRDLYPQLEPLLTRANRLDPYFRSIYRLAGTALTLNGMEVELSNRLLRRGVKYRPDVWEIPFYLGFNTYYFEHDFEKAAEILARAAKLPGAPEHTGGVATRLAAEAGRPEIGLQLVEEILAQMPEDENDELRKQYVERRNTLALEVQLGWLNEAASRFRAERGTAATSLDDLLSAGLLTEIPQEPLGGTYRIEDGVVVSSNDDRRLRLPEVAKKQLAPRERRSP